MTRTSSASVPILCVFLEKMSAVPQTPKNILGSLLKQLVQLREVVAPNIREAYTKASSVNASVTSKELEKLLKVSNCYLAVFFVV